MCAARVDSSGTGTMLTVPQWLWLFSLMGSPSFGLSADPIPRRLETMRLRCAASKARPDGNQATGINPPTRDSRFAGSNRMTATAFCDPLATKSVLPSASKASALGCAPNGSAGVVRAQILSRTAPVAASITLSVSAPALAATTLRPSGEIASALQ